MTCSLRFQFQLFQQSNHPQLTLTVAIFLDHFDTLELLEPLEFHPPLPRHGNLAEG